MKAQEVWKQEHSDRPQMFSMRGETVLICKSTKTGKYLVQGEKLRAPAYPVQIQCDFLQSIHQYITQYFSTQADQFRIEGFLKMEQQIITDTYEQNIRNIFLLSFQGDDSSIVQFKPKEEIMSTSTDIKFKEYINYVENGGIAYPMQLFVQEGSQVKLPKFTSEKQENQLKQSHKKILGIF